MAAVESDRELLDKYWISATTRADVCLGKWLLGRHDSCGSDGVYSVTLQIPHCFNLARLPAICHTLRDMIAADIVADWLAVAAPDIEARYRSAVEDLTLQMRRIMDAGRKKRMEVV